MSVKFYQVGGSVRDTLLGEKSRDIDYAVEASSFEDMRAAILSRGGEIFLETPQYFTIRAKVPALGACDFTLCRKEHWGYSDGRHPDKVEVGSLMDDLARRDFTINAMAYGEDGALIDPYGGVDDLADRKVKCVGRADERFTEDGLRMLRALRFAIVKGFGLDHDIVDCLLSRRFFEPRLRGVSTERIKDELHKCFQHSTNETLIRLTIYTELRSYIFNNHQLWLKPTMEAR